MQFGLQAVLMLGMLAGSVWMRPRAQNPFEQLAMGALSVGNQIMSTLQEGSAARQQINFDNPLMALHSKTDVGYGDAMRSGRDDDSDSDSEESKRRRRRRRSSSSLHMALHGERGKRGKRSPCKWKDMMPTESADEVEERKARARKRAANNVSRSRINKKTKKKLQESSRRRRRQSMPDDFMQQQQGPNIADRLKGMWLSVVDSVADAFQQVHQKIKGAAAQAAGGN